MECQTKIDMIESQRPYSQPTLTPSERTVRLLARLRRHLLFAAWGLMEVALIVPLAIVLMPWLTQYSPLWLTVWITLLFLSPYYLSQLLSQLNLSNDRQRLILVVAALLIVIGAIGSLLYDGGRLFDLSWMSELFFNIRQAGNNLWHRDFGLFLLIVVIWWRGMQLINRELDVSRFGQQFRRWGLIVAPLVLLLVHWRAAFSVLPFLLLFLMAGLTAVILTRIEQAERDQAAILVSVDGQWFGLIFGAGLLIVLLSMALAFGVNGRSGEWLGQLLMPLWLGIRFAAAAVLLTITFIVSPLFPILENIATFLSDAYRRLFLWFFSANEQEVEEETPMTELFAEFVNEKMLEAQQDGYSAFLDWKIVLLLVLIALVIFVIVQLVRSYRTNKALVGDGRFANAVGGLRRRISANRAQRTRQKTSFQQLDWRAALTIQRIYERMSFYAKEEGYGREPTQTPYEYLPTLHTLWPNHADQANLITRAFVQVRYGQLPETQKEFDAIQQAWQRLEDAVLAELHK